jgi:hypothetical protein
MIIKAGMFALLLCLALTPVSCGSDKTGDTAESGVERRDASIEHTISSDDLETVQWLFEKNGLDLDRFQVIGFNINAAGTDNLEASYYGVRAQSDIQRSTHIRHTLRVRRLRIQQV